MAWCENNGIGYIFGPLAMSCSTAWLNPPPMISGCSLPVSQAEVLRGFADARSEVAGKVGQHDLRDLV